MIQSDSISEQANPVLRTLLSPILAEQLQFDDIKRLLNHSLNPPSEIEKEESLDAVRNVLIYPPTGKGGISINTEDYLCLATDQYLNDVIIDFYLQYVLREVIAVEQRQKTHIFSSFFYNRLTTNSKTSAPGEQKLTAAQKRHERVKNWTKNVNLFEKDYIVIPINEQSHWFLAIICFPALKGPVSMKTNAPIKPMAVVKRKPAAQRKQITPLQIIGSTTITPVSAKKEIETLCVDAENERDEAEGDDSELGSDESDTDTGDAKTTLEPIKQYVCLGCPPVCSEYRFLIIYFCRPCILLFDSLAGANRNRVVATLRDYLTCEYRVKVREASNHSFTKFNLPGNSVKVPQQTNFTDCGLYVLQYVEHFFKVSLLRGNNSKSEWFEIILSFVEWNRIR